MTSLLITLTLASNMVGSIRIIGLIMLAVLSIMGAIIALMAGLDFITSLTFGTANSAVTAYAFVWA